MANGYWDLKTGDELIACFDVTAVAGWWRNDAIPEKPGPLGDMAASPARRIG